MSELDIIRDDMNRYLTGSYDGINHGESISYDRFSISWASGKQVESWVNIGTITGDFQEGSGDFEIKEIGQRIHFIAIVYTLYNTNVIANDRLKYNDLYYRVAYIRNHIDHDEIYLDSFEGET